MREFRQRLGPSPLNKDSFDKWTDYCDRIEREDIRTLNKMIEKFNLIVPNMNNQMFPLNFQKEAENIFNSAFDPNVRVAKDGREKERSLETKKTDPETPNSTWWSFLKR